MAAYVGLRVAVHGLGDMHGHDGPTPEEVRDKVGLLLIDEFPEVEVEIDEAAESLRDIHDAVEEWQTRDDARTEGTSVTLHAFLGMSWEQYARWVEGKMSADELATFGFRMGES